MSLKENYIKLSKNLGGTHSLISKGLKKSIVDSIMRGSDIGSTMAYEVAKILGVTMEELLTGNYDVKKVHSPEEQKYVDKLVQILRGNEEDKKTTIKTNLDSLKRDIWENSPRKTKQPEVNLKKTKSL
ncbi:MAG: hypothetical protein HW406_2831 [Candidatus Brocadiaceae bacterium]|nr:hypothetical protein [Candidatus Brocadiaceae bacterium]